MRPALVADRPGRYTLEVTVDQRRQGRPGSRSAVSTDALEDSDFTTLSATPPVSSLGVPINTIDQQSSGGAQIGVQVGTSLYAPPNLAYGLQLVTLDRATLALGENESFPDTTAGAAALLAAVQSLDSSVLVIITKTGLDGNNPDPATTAQSINTALAAIGADPVPSSVSTGSAGYTGCSNAGGECSQFSAIGIPGIPAGQGSVNPGLATLSSLNSNLPYGGAQQGDLHGYLQQDVTDTNFSFIDYERVPFSTGPAGSDPAVVTIGSNEAGSPVPVTSFTSQTITGGGWYVLVLDSGSLVQDAQGTFQDNAAGVSQMQTLLGTWDQNPDALVIIRSIDSVDPSGDGTGADAIAQSITALGASPYLFYQLNGSTNGQYAQVGPVPDTSQTYPNSDVQVATTASSGTTSLTGLLARNASGEFAPSESVPGDLNNSAEPLSGTLTGLISLPATAWPSYTAGEQNVVNCIAANIYPSGLSTPIQSNYINQNLVGSWSAFASTIGAAGYFTTLSNYSNCQPFTQADFESVEPTLAAQWQQVAVVWSMIDNLQSALVDSQGDVVDVESVASAVANDVGVGSQTASFSTPAVASDLLWIISTIPPFAEADDAINFFSGGLSLASDLSRSPSGDLQDQISSAADNLGESLQTQYTTQVDWLNTIGDILVQDPNKLAIAGANAADSPGSAANWGWNSATADTARNALMVSARQQTYNAIFPLSYNLYAAEDGDAPGSVNPSAVGTYPCSTFMETEVGRGETSWNLLTWQPFMSAPTNSVIPVTVQSDDTTDLWVNSANDDFLNSEFPVAASPSATLLDGLYAAPTDDPYQGNTPLFSSPLNFDIGAYNDATTNTQTVTHTSATETDFPDHKVSTDTVCQLG